MKWIDLNADLGEGCTTDSAIIPLLSSANISCGAHAGSEPDIRAALLACKAHQVTVGAHPSYPDPANFGRLPMAMPSDALRASLAQQLQYFQQLADDCGVLFCYVKPHGALYNQAAVDRRLADLLVDVIQTHDPSLAVLTLPGSQLHQAAQAAGMAVFQEAFADRAYQADGQLVVRSEPGAVLAPEAAIRQSLQLVGSGFIQAKDGNLIAMAADSLCLHGDSPQALALAQALRQALQDAGVRIQAFTGSCA